MGVYEKTRYRGILRYVGSKGEAYVIDFYANGKRHREKIEGGLTKVREEMEKRRKAGRRGTYIAQTTLNKTTMGDLIKKFTEEKKGNPYFEKTECHYVDMIGQYFEGRKLVSIKAEDFDHFLKARVEVLKKDGKTRSNASANGEVALFRHLLNKAVYYEMLEINPFDKFARERKRTNNNKVFLDPPIRDRVLDPSELDQIFPHCRPYLQNIILGLLYTGLRVRDLLNLKWEDISWEKQSFTFIERKKSRDGIPKKVEKPLTLDYINLLNSIPRKEKGNGYIFVGNNGRPIKNPPKGFDRMRKKAGITDIRMRDLRRTSASALLDKGASLPAIQRHLGHTELAMTEKYLHMNPKQERKEIEKLNGYFVPRPASYGQKMGRNDEIDDFATTDGFAANA
jgi:integrase